MAAAEMEKEIQIVSKALKMEDVKSMEEEIEVVERKLELECKRD